MKTFYKIIMFFIIVLFVCLQIASAQNGVVCPSRCPKITPMQNFDVAAYSKGIWYEAFRYPNKLEPVDKCLRASYAYVKGVVYIETIGVPENCSDYALLVGVITPEAKGTGNITSIWTTGPPRQTTQLYRYVLDTDYYSYAVIYACIYNRKMDNHQVYAWIETRDNKYAGKAKEAVETYLDSTCLIKRNKLIPSDNSKKACEEAAKNICKNNS